MRKLCGILVAIGLFVGSASIARAAEIQAVIPEVIERNQALAAPTLSANKYSDSSVTYVATSFLCLLSKDGSGCSKTPTQANSSTNSQHADYGVYGSLVGLVSNMYKYQPATVDRYVADLMKDMHIAVAQPAYAQGLGFSALDPILSVWKIFRNISYMGFILIFIGIGFMIMFRQKIGSQTVVTVQQAIPSIVVALLAVTFSYAIAGLMIDVMYLAMYFLASLFTGGTDLISGNVFEIAWKILTSHGAASAGADAVANFVNSTMGGGLVSNVAGLLAGLTAAIIIWLVIIFNSFKLFFKLLNIYVDIILNIAFAPIILMTGAIPGKNAFGGWLRNLAADLAVFPGVLLLLIIFTVLQNSVSNQAGGFNPPYIGGSSSASYLPFLAGLALILALPEAVDEIKKALGGTQGGIFGTLINAGLKNMGQGMPLASRAVGIVGGGGLDAAQAGVRGFVTSGGSLRDRAEQAWTRGSAGFMKGATRGAHLADISSQAMGVRAPAVMNPIIEKIDQRFNPKAAARQRSFEALAEAMQQMGTIGTPGAPTGTPTNNKKT